MPEPDCREAVDEQVPAAPRTREDYRNGTGALRILTSRSSGRAASVDIQVLVECDERRPELAEALLAEERFPFGFQRHDRLSHQRDGLLAPRGEPNRDATLAVGQGATFDIAQLRQLAEQVVHRLFAHVRIPGQLGGAGPSRTRVLKNVEVRRVDVREPLSN